MKKFQFNKLVRDKIPDHMMAEGQFIEGLRELDDISYVKELRIKIIEEAMELGDVNDNEKIKEEIADVREVLECLQKVLKISDDEIKAFQKKKISKNGAFDKKIYIESVGVDEGSQWHEYYLKNPKKYPEIKN